MKFTALIATAWILSTAVSATRAENLSSSSKADSSRSKTTVANSVNTCCVAHPEPGCSDPNIAACVCKTLPECCDVSWTISCAAEIDRMACGSCESCCQVSQRPGCIDPDIMACVCGHNPGCCITSWGEECVAAVDSKGCGCCSANCPPNDDCADSPFIRTDVTLRFDTTTATTDGPAIVEVCDPDDPFIDAPESDVWYCVRSECDSEITVSLCGDPGGSFDSFLAVHEGCACPVGNNRLVACNNDSCGTQASLTYIANSFFNYSVQVGGNGESGIGQIQFSGLQTDNHNDCNNNFVFDGCDVDSGLSTDCNQNRVPDECELAGKVVYQQPPNQVGALFSDAGCNSCPAPNFAQSIADQFRISQTTTIRRARIWGGYFPAGVPTPDDIFAMRIKQAVNGEPGREIFAGLIVGSTRTLTNENMFGVDNFEYDLVLESAFKIEPGDYFLEIFNNTIGNAGSFFWKTGFRDSTDTPSGGIADLNAAPGANWIHHEDDMAFLLSGDPLTDCNGNEILDICEEILAGVPGDLNGDCIFDINDHPLFLDCLNGPGVGPVSPECRLVDIDQDDDVDLFDTAALEVLFENP